MHGISPPIIDCSKYRNKTSKHVAVWHIVVLYYCSVQSTTPIRCRYSAVSHACDRCAMLLLLRWLYYARAN